MLTPSVVLRRALVAGAAVTTALALSACGDASAPGSGTAHNPGMMTSNPAMMASGAPAGAVPGFNSADVMFARMMIPHHRQAIEMADLAAGRAGDEQVKTLAATIKAAQQPEIDTMAGWLDAWGVPMPGMTSTTSMPDMGHGMPGSMSRADMAKLTAVKGTAFDRLFLTMMIDHHAGAITMAKQESAAGANTAAQALAAKIATDQQAQITQMRTMLSSL